MPRTLRPSLQIVVLAVLAAGAILAYTTFRPAHRQEAIATFADVPVKPGGPKAFTLTASQLATVSSEPVVKRRFFEEIATEGKIGVDEYMATPVFSPYPGRVIAIFARTGDQVKRGQPLFSVQANEMVQAQNDYLAALNVLNKSRSQLNFAQAAEKRQRDLFETRTTTLRELQVAQNDLTSATNDNRTAEVGLEAVRNRLRILGLRDEDMAALQKGSAINPNTRNRSFSPSSTLAASASRSCATSQTFDRSPMM